MDYTEAYAKEGVKRLNESNQLLDIYGIGYRLTVRLG